MFTVVGYYTKNTPYEAEAMEMKKSAEQWGLQVILYPVNSTGSWISNCQKKASIILRACMELKQPFLYVDVDARFTAYPDFIAALHHEDMAVHHFKSVELLSGTIWVNPTVNTINVICDWIIENERQPRLWDQKTLQAVLSKPKHEGLALVELPPEYTWIYDLSERYYGQSHPVITHYQASRQYKRRV